MRRLLPWALLGLLGIGTVLGAALGAASAPGTTGPTPEQWVAGVLATTQSAGTAHLRDVGVTASPNPILRGTAAASGDVDFGAGTFRVSEVQHQNDWTTGPGGTFVPHPETAQQAQIGVGRTLYLSFGPANVVGWVKEPVPRLLGSLGLESAAGVGGALAWLSPPFVVRSVHEIGTAVLAGVVTTRYVVRTQLQQECPKAAVPAHPATQRTTIWIDRQGRLVQVQSSSSISGTIPAALVRQHPELADRPQGSTTQSDTLHLSAFGRPVHIAAPPAVVSGGGNSLSISTARLTCAP